MLMLLARESFDFPCSSGSAPSIGAADLCGRILEPRA